MFILHFNSHMGISVVNKERGDIDKVISSLKEALAEAQASKSASA